MIVIAAAYWPTASALLALARRDRYYGYLALVLPVVALLLWASRHGRTAAAQDVRRGVPIVATGVVLLALGHAASSLHLQSVSFVVAAVGAAVWLRGSEWARAAAYPLAFLLFLVPLPRALFDAISPDLQRLLARQVAALLDAASVPASLDGAAIHLPTVTLVVVEACNGLRFLMGLVVLMGGAAGLLLSSGLARALVIVLAVPAAVTANVARITATGLIAHWFGADAAQGTLHEVVSKIIWVATLVALIAATWSLGRRPRLHAQGQETGVAASGATTV